MQCWPIYRSAPWHHYSVFRMRQHVRPIKDLRPWDQVTSALQDLHWLLIRHRITYQLCVLMHLVHTGSSPSCLSGLVTATANMSFRKRLRSADTNYYTNRSLPDSSLANDVFHTTDPKLGWIAYRASGFNGPQSVQTQAEDIFCLNMRLLYGEQSCRWSLRCKR